MTQDIDYSDIYIYRLKEINYAFYCHPFHLQVESNALFKFLKAFVSFFQGEKNSFLGTEACVYPKMLGLEITRSGLTYFKIYANCKLVYAIFLAYL